MACHHHIEGDCPICDRVEAHTERPGLKVLGIVCAVVLAAFLLWRLV